MLANPTPTPLAYEPRKEPLQPPGPAEIADLARIAKNSSGISLEGGKGDFLHARLVRRLAQLGIPDYASYAALLDSPAGELEHRHFLEAITTHTTRFFRERSQYDWLRTHGIPLLREDGAGLNTELIIWSAACSSGQELYSALMIVGEKIESNGLRLRYSGIGTDLSQKILRNAELGIYCSEDVSDIPEHLRREFLLSSIKNPNLFKICPSLREKAKWVHANLTEHNRLPHFQANVAFLRNVLIYFDLATRKQVIRNVLSRIAPGGFLLTGHTETLSPREFGLTAIRPSIYRKDEQ
ncbi:MAG: CheR family methyltransferase [Paracoccaceae bacterium]